MRQYPQETIGITLLQCEAAGEYRRVFVGRRNGQLEVGEFTHGPLTDVLYEAPSHHHCVCVSDASVHMFEQLLAYHLSRPGERDVEALLAEYFGQNEPLLADLMDLLDRSRVPYGYLSSVDNDHVSYRPERPQGVAL